MSDSGAPASTQRRRHGQGPRRGVGMRERRGVHDDAGHQRGRERPVAERRAGCRGGRREQRDHLAGRRGMRVDPVGVAGGVVRGVVVDDDARQALEQLRMALADGADALQRPAVGDDEQVVGGAPGRGRCGTRSTPGRKSYSGGGGSRADRVGRRRRAPRRSGRRRASPRACRRRGSRARRRARAAAPRSRSTTTVGHGAEVGRQVDASSAACVGALRAAPACARAAAAVGARLRRPVRPPTAAPSARVALVRERGDRRRQGLAERQRRRPARPGLELVEQLQDARAALGGVVEPDVEVGDPLDAQRPAQLVPDERHRPAERRDGRVALGRLADHADPDPRMAQVRRRLDVGDRREPDPRIGDLPGEDRRRSPAAGARRSGPFVGSSAAGRLVARQPASALGSPSGS